MVITYYLPEAEYFYDCMRTIYADDIALQSNTPAQDESLLQNRERAGGGIGFYVNADKTEYMCFNERDISTLNGDSRKHVDKFTFIGSSFS